MAKVSDNALIKLLGWPQGLDNLSSETELPIGKPGSGGEVRGSLRVAENVDIDEAGKVSRREGYALVGHAGLHSVYAHPEFALMLAVHAGQLVSFDVNETKTDVVALAAPDRPMSYDHTAGWVYYSNGIDSGRVDGDGNREEWATLPPLGTPTLTAYAAGGLAQGTYQIALTYLEASGRESGASLSEQVELVEGQGVMLTQIPQPSDAAITAIRVYATAANGTVMHAVYDMPVGLTQFLVGVHIPGKTLDTEFHEPLPAGHIVRIHNGRHFVARDKVLYWSEALHNGQGVLARNYLKFNERIDMVEGWGQGPESGLYIAAGTRTYYMGGAEPAKWTRKIAHPVGAVPRSSLQVDQQILTGEGSGTVPYWLDRDGQFVTGTQGGVQALHKQRYAGPKNVESAAVTLREQGGLRHIISSLKGGVANGLAITDTADAEVWRDGVQVA